MKVIYHSLRRHRRLYLWYKVVGSNPTLVRVFLCPCVGPIPILGLIPDGIIGYKNFTVVMGLIRTCNHYSKCYWRTTTSDYYIYDFHDYIYYFHQIGDHPASRAFLNSTRKKRICRLYWVRASCCLETVSNPGQVSIALLESLLDAILMFVLKARFWPTPCQKYDARAA